MLKITLVGSADTVLPDLLTGLGLQVVSADTPSLEALATNGPPDTDILFVDTRTSGIPPSLAVIRRKHPTLPIVVVGASLESKFLLDAMRGGASEVAAEPFKASDLERMLIRLAGQHGAGTGFAFGFIGAKGGVGTTTIAVNVAVALARLGRPARTLLIDLHEASGDVAVCFSATPRFTVADAMENTHRLDPAYLRGLVAQVAPELDLLAAPDRAVAVPFDADRLRMLMNVATGLYKYIVIDLARTDPRVTDALDQLHGIIVVANQELPTVRSAARLVPVLRQRYGADKVHLVISRSDRHSEIHDEDAERAIGMTAMHSVPSDYRAAVRAVNLGRPVVIANHSALASSFVRLAETLAGAREEPRPVKPGLFSRLVRSHAEQG